MSLIVNNAEIQTLDQLSDKTQTLIQLLAHGEQCLYTLINQDEVMVFTSDEQFVEELYSGLTNSTLLFLNHANLSVDVKKLFELSTNDLRDLATYNKTEIGSSDTNLHALFSKYHLISNSALNRIALFYRRYDLSYHALNWSANFNDQINLYNSLIYWEKAYNLNSPLVKTASSWAMQKAQNLSEFSNYLWVYFAWQSKTHRAGKSIDEIVSILTPIVLDNLDSPVVTYELDQINLNQALKQWHEKQKTLGFYDFTTGLLNIVLNIDLQAPDLSKAANTYIANLQNQLINTLANDSYINQAGIFRHYVFDLNTTTAALNVDSQGCLSLFSDWPVLNNI
ncbi:hypothetical protein EYS14_19460 [Alteromonadaceae bacterium M269]|nr:hypothetical protein EYS14_19460 [Alteromonadaceae bacterium M269]